MATITVHSLPMYNEVNDFLINFLVHLQAKQIYRIPIWQNILKQSDHWRKLECEGCTMNDKMTIWCLTANCLKLITKNWLNYGPHEAPRSSKPITFSVYKCTFVKFIYSEKATKSLRNLHLFLTGTSISQKRWRFRKVFVAFSEYMNFMQMFPDISEGILK